MLSFIGRASIVLVPVHDLAIAETRIDGTKIETETGTGTVIGIEEIAIAIATANVGADHDHEIGETGTEAIETTIGIGRDGGTEIGTEIEGGRGHSHH